MWEQNDQGLWFYNGNCRVCRNCYNYITESQDCDYDEDTHGRGRKHTEPHLSCVHLDMPGCVSTNT